MGKFYNSDYEEVVAFSQEELDAKLKEAVAEAESAKAKELEEATQKLTEKEAEYEKLSKKYDSRKEEYDNAKKQLEELQGKVEGATGERKEAFEKMRDSYIERAAGDDKEYAEELKKQFERVGSETLDPSELEASLKDAHALALNSLNRDFTSFSMSAAATGEAPAVKPDGDKTFTETDEGKATMSHVYQSMGMEISSDNTGDGDKK